VWLDGLSTSLELPTPLHVGGFLILVNLLNGYRDEGVGFMASGRAGRVAGVAVGVLASGFSLVGGVSRRCCWRLCQILYDWTLFQQGYTFCRF
jgi:hypothetical protein